MGQNIQNTFFCHFDAGVTTPRPSALMAISNIVGLCSNKQVLRIHTGGVIARMPYHQSLWDGAVGFSPSVSMGSTLAVWPITTAKHSVITLKPAFK